MEILEGGVVKGIFILTQWIDAHKYLSRTGENKFLLRVGYSSSSYAWRYIWCNRNSGIFTP